jgi:hypothetical protein
MHATMTWEQQPSQVSWTRTAPRKASHSQEREGVLRLLGPGLGRDFVHEDTRPKVPDSACHGVFSFLPDKGNWQRCWRENPPGRVPSTLAPSPPPSSHLRERKLSKERVPNPIGEGREQFIFAPACSQTSLSCGDAGVRTAGRPGVSGTAGG